MQKDISRKIVHIDMDAFYASVEQRDNPDLKGKPIAVGGGANRGVTTTASYEARKYGVRSAMPGWKAKQLCPQLIFVPPRFAAYKEVSTQIRSIFSEYTDLIEPLSLDEAFLDVTDNKKQIPYGMEVAQEIMDRVKEETQLTCSAGVSYCKFLAKIASDVKKPNGLTVITPKRAELFLENLEIGKFFGVGKVTAAKMEHHGILKGSDLKKYSQLELAQKFGKMGIHFYHIVRGIDNRPVNPHRVRKSLAIERTLENDLEEIEEIESILIGIADKFYERLVRADNFGRTITLKIKKSDFQSITRSISKDYFIKDKEEIKSLAINLLEQNKEAFSKIRLIGLTATNLEKELVDIVDLQLSFDWEE
jgi:DNA polymerase-4